jgi:hypothetical protein
MNPKKFKKLYSVVSEDLNLKESLIEDLVDFYYKEARTLLTELKYPRINVDGLGQFVIKPFLVEKHISIIDKSIYKLDTSTFKAYHTKRSMENKLELLNKIHEKINEQANRKSEFLKTKYNEERT